MPATAWGRTSEVRHKPSRTRLIRRRAYAAIRANLGLRENQRLPKKKIMKTERPEPNAELSQTFEPLRFVFAIGALLLGFVASLRF
jgi:hypothetical protein